MAQYLLFAALVQSGLITLYLGLKINRKKIPSILFFILILNYTLVLFRAIWNGNNADYQLNKLHLPFSYAMGPVFYYFVRFSFLPIKDQVSKRWVLWFIPFLFQLLTSLWYWLFVIFKNPISLQIESFAKVFFSIDFFYFLAFFLASIMFLFRHNPLITMNLIYKKQLRLLKIFMLFVILFIIGEFANFKGEDVFSGIIACAFTSAFLLYLLRGSTAFDKQIQRNKELLKEALVERHKAVVITNAEKIVEYVNEAFLNIVGYRHRDVIGRKLSFLRGNLTTPESIEYMRAKLNEKVDFEVDIINYRKNGEAYVCHILMIPVFSENQLTHFIAYEEDVETIAAPEPLDEDWILFEKINAYFKENEPCSNPQLQVANIADAMDLSARKIGEILKRCADQSFTEYVNSSRIKAALKMLRNPDFQHLTVEAIGQAAGFNSKSIFYAAFKKETGKTPKIFLEENKV